MRDRFIGAIGALWGGLLLVRAFLQYARGAGAPLSLAQGLSLVLALAGIAAHAAAAQRSVDLPHEVDAWRARFVAAQRTFDGRRPYYVEDTAKFVVGSIDQRSVAALLFTLEGQRAADDWQQYAAVFWSSAGHYLYCCEQRVGAKGLRLLDDIGIVDDRIRLSGKGYATADAPCCPSRPLKVGFVLARHRLAEVGAGR